MAGGTFLYVWEGESKLNQTHTHNTAKLYKVEHNCEEKADIKTPTSEYADVMSSCMCVYASKLKP